jgi:hypothetical protein
VEGKPRLERLDAIGESSQPTARLESGPPMPSSTISTSTRPFFRTTRTLATDAWRRS